MNILQPILVSIATLVTLFILTKIMGKRQISQLNFFDYIIGITIGSIAAEATVDPNTFLNGIISMTTYAIIALLISIGTCKSIRLRRLVSGKSTILYEKGKLYEKNLLKSRLDIGEFLMQCRLKGYFDISKINTAVMEANGQLSFIPVAQEKPTVVQDIDVQVPQDTLVANVIIDGNVMARNLQYTGNNETWLHNQLNSKNTKLNEVLLATCDNNNKLVIYKKTNEINNKEVFE